MATANIKSKLQSWLLYIEPDVNETQSASSETEETGLLTYDNEAYNLDSQKAINPADHEKEADSESFYEDLTGEQDIYDVIAATWSKVKSVDIHKHFT